MPVEAAVPCTGLCDRGAGYTSSVQITPRSGCWRPVGSATPNGQMGYRGADYMCLVQITPRSQSVRHTTCPLRQPRVARMLLPPPLHPRLRRHPATQRPTVPMARQLIMEHGLNGDDSAPLCRRSPSRPVHSWSHRRSRQGSERSARDPGQSESNPKITFAADLLSLSGSSETQARGASFARFATHHHHREIPCARLCAVVRG